MTSIDRIYGVAWESTGFLGLGTPTGVLYELSLDSLTQNSWFYKILLINAKQVPHQSAAA